MIGIEMSLFHKRTKFDKTQHNYIGGICIGFIMRRILAVVGILNHWEIVRLRILNFSFKIKLSKQCSIKKERNTSILLYHTFQRLRQDLPKLMIPQELSTRYGIKLMLANMWDAELWSSLLHKVNFIMQKRLQQKMWTLWNNLEWGDREVQTSIDDLPELCH